MRTLLLLCCLWAVSIPVDLMLLHRVMFYSWAAQATSEQPDARASDCSDTYFTILLSAFGLQILLTLLLLVKARRTQKAISTKEESVS